MMPADPIPDLSSVAASTDPTAPTEEMPGALIVRNDARPSDNSHLKAGSLSEHSSKVRSKLGSISSGLISMARSSSSASRSAKRSSTGPAEDGLSGPLSKLSPAEYMSLFNPTPSGRTPLPIPMVLDLRFPRIRKHPSPKSSVDLNGRLIAECCGISILPSSSPGTPCADDGEPDLPDCIHRRLLRAITALREDNSSGLGDFTSTLTTAEANTIDDFGNLLIHTAARWGAGVPILISILRHTDDVSSTNCWGQTFLHVYDPPAAPLFSSALFSDLVKYLRGRGFDFCQRDVEKQVVLHRLVLRSEFRVEMLHCIFCHLPQGSARFLMLKRSAEDKRLFDYVQKKLEQQSPQLKRVFGDEREFVRRYLPEFHDFELKRQTPRGPLRDLQAFVASLYDRFVGTQGTHEKPPVPQEASPKCHSDNGNSGVKRTKLMDFLRQSAILNEDPTTEMLSAQLPKGQEDQDLARRDREGNTALHYAAEFGMVTAVQFLCGLKVGLNTLNNCGNTPLQLISYAIQQTDVRSDINMESRYMRSAIVLLDAGADFRGREHVQRPRGRIEELSGQIFDGSEGQIKKLTGQEVTDCKGLHLLIPLKKPGTGRHDRHPSTSVAFQR